MTEPKPAVSAPPFVCADEFLPGVLRGEADTLPLNSIEQATKYSVPLIRQAADRIEELERDLATAIAKFDALSRSIEHDDATFVCKCGAHIKSVWTKKLIAERDRAERALREILRYFDSGNDAPVERATIRADSAEIVAARAYFKEKP